MLVEKARGRYRSGTRCWIFCMGITGSGGEIFALLYRLALPRALFQELDIVRDEFVARILALGFRQLDARALVVAAQHIGIALVIEDFRSRPDDADGLIVGAVGEL